jgi:YhcG PDDEXK nuclease domain
VVIDLKVGELAHQDIGQMDMYVRLFEERMRSEGDNPTIGLILCTEKDETIVRYSVLKENRQLFASKYRLMLPTEEELRHELERERAMLLETMPAKQKQSQRRTNSSEQTRSRRRAKSGRVKRS